MATNPRIRHFLDKNADFIDTDELGNPEGYKEFTDGGKTYFTVNNDGQPITYEVQSGRAIMPTMAFKKQHDARKPGRRFQAPEKPAAQTPQGERVRKPVHDPAAPAEQPTTPSQPSQATTATSQASDTDDAPAMHSKMESTKPSQYLRLARHIIEG